MIALAIEFGALATCVECGDGIADADLVLASLPACCQAGGSVRGCVVIDRVSQVSDGGRLLRRCVSLIAFCRGGRTPPAVRSIPGDNVSPVIAAEIGRAA